jgi:hypothetical protein
MAGAAAGTHLFERLNIHGSAVAVGDDRTPGTLIGEVNLLPRAASELQRHYSLGVGEFTLDLRQLDLAGETREVDISVGVGELEVIVPPDLSIEIHGRTGVGDSRVMGKSGLVIDHEDLVDGFNKLIVNYSVGIGEAKVRREL